MRIRGGQLKVLTKGQIKRIYLGILEILENVGVVFNEKNALKIFNDAGAVVDEKTRIVKIPQYLVEEAIRKTPRRFTVYARNSKYDVAMEDKVVWFEPMIGRKDVVDLNTGEKRPTSIEDARNLMKLVDALDNFNIASGSLAVPWTTSEELGMPKTIRRARAFLRVLDTLEKPVDMNKEYIEDPETEYCGCSRKK